LIIPLAALCEEPTKHGVVVMGAGISRAPGGKMVRLKFMRFLVVFEHKLKNSHARKLKSVSKRIDLLGDEIQILGDNR